VKLSCCRYIGKFGGILQQTTCCELVSDVSSAENMQFNFSHLYQQQELSDLDVLVVGPVQQQQDNSSSGPGGPSHELCRLASFPGHAAILSNSPFFKAQVRQYPTHLAQMCCK
jgi:hypothetical protein